MTRIAILDDYQNVALSMADWSLLEGAEITVFDAAFASMDAAAAALAGFDVLCIMRERTPFPRPLFERLSSLKLLATTGHRNASIDLAAAKDHGVTVCSTRSLPHATPELTWGLILALARNIPTEERNMGEGRWQTTVGTVLHGKTLGILGLGRIGSRVAAVGAAFGMDIIAWSQNLTDARAAECGARRVEKDDLFRQADILTIHVQLSERTRGLVGAPELAQMKPTAFLVNTSRGPIIDEAALLDALERRQIGGAGIDVYWTEPLPAGHPLRRAPLTVLTPHLGYVTEDSYRVFFTETVENIQAFLAGKPIRVLE